MFNAAPRNVPGLSAACPSIVKVTGCVVFLASNCTVATEIVAPGGIVTPTNLSPTVVVEPLNPMLRTAFPRATAPVAAFSSASSELAATEMSSVAAPSACTVTTTSSLASSSVSVAVRRKVYEPAAVNETVVDGESGSANVARPGPDTRLHVDVTFAPAGSPSSVTVPERAAELGNVI